MLVFGQLAFQSGGRHDSLDLGTPDVSVFTQSSDFMTLRAHKDAGGVISSLKHTVQILIKKII